jgi:hypothetical protein
MADTETVVHTSGRGVSQNEIANPDTLFLLLVFTFVEGLLSPLTREQQQINQITVGKSPSRSRYPQSQGRSR